MKYSFHKKSPFHIVCVLAEGVACKSFGNVKKTLWDACLLYDHIPNTLLVENTCGRPTVVEEESIEPTHEQIGFPAVNVLQHNSLPWVGKYDNGEGYFKLDLGCEAEVRGFEMDNSCYRQGKSTGIRKLQIYGAESSRGPWTWLFTGKKLTKEAEANIDIEPIGPFRFLKIISKDSYGKRACLRYFSPILQEKKGK